ncbi:T9SS type A sorting domain-containing protein [Aestuariibaculum marinum]|uniref:T9SS type A sorting domain-containing protein n=1 Tax=Aestuariibaculum marinum TaxID=2683592 RepID=A0A8J6Q065_9FLAO|nr:T9SS type A sorting domain-containing protein [Aestuariibaculum marinum]MBD0822684.1 T9SS type A sorting domain-containing protein [Aestuariibaculum marinum]
MKKTTIDLIQVTLLFCCQILFSQAPPANDLCSGAIALTVDPNGGCTYETVTFNGYETDSGITNPDCANYVGDDIWFSAVVPSTGAITIETNKDSFSGPTSIDNGGMAIYTGDCNNLVLYECNDDGNSTLAPFEKITFSGTIGETIYIRLWQNNVLDNAGTHRICAYAVEPPLEATNDNCDTAIQLTLNTSCSPIIGSNFRATNSGVAVSNCGNGNDDVWFKIVLDDTKDYDIAIETYEDTDNSITDAVMAVYSENESGNCTAGLSEITCDDDSGIITNENFERIELFGRRNETIFVRIWSLDNLETGTFNICATDISSLDDKDFLSQDFVLFPNPAQSSVNLKFKSGTNNNLDISIYNIQGKLVLRTQKIIENSHLQLDVSNLSHGFYFLKVYDGLHTMSKKLIIK